MAKQTTSKQTEQTTTISMDKPMTEVQRMRAERAAMDERIKQATAAERAENAAKRAERTRKSLEQVITEEDAVMTAWTPRDLQRLTVRVLARMHAEPAQSRADALAGVLEMLGTVLGTELDRRAGEKAAQGDDTTA